MIKYANQYLRSAVSIIEAYDGSIPLSAFLKQYFKTNTKFGSRDRRYISHLCYTYFRTGCSLKGTIADKTRAAIFLCETGNGEWDGLFDDEWLDVLPQDIDQKWEFIQIRLPGSDRDRLFSWRNELSEGVDAKIFSDSHLIQPDLFLRIRPGHERNVLEKLQKADLPFQQLSPDCIALANSTKIEGVVEVNKEVVIQDLSSQQVSVFFPEEWMQQKHHPINIWDCCAASGGKSLLAHDILKNVHLTVSDIRPSILHNLQTRFREAGINRYDSFVADMQNKTGNIPARSFDLVICDAPCSGSGTWGRTPEQLVFFSTAKINEYAALQKKIATNAVSQVTNGGYFLYITCSVFAKENEDTAAFIQKQPGFSLVKSSLIKGYDKKADTMFAALFCKAEKG